MIVSRRRDDGFTLMEVMLVVAFSIFLFALLLPSFNKYRQRQGAKSAATLFEGDVKRAQTEAIKAEKEMVVSFGQSGAYISYSIKSLDESWTLRKNYEPSATYLGAHIKEGDGVTSGGKLTFGNGGKIDTSDTTNNTLTLFSIPGANIGYYRVIIEGGDGSQFAVKIYETGQVKTELQ